MDNANTYLSLEALAATLSLPQNYLRGLAESEDIPSLNVNGRLRFNIIAVQQALDKLASKGASNDR
jgi:hypothetical protein